MSFNLWEMGEKAFDSIPNPKEQLRSFVDKVTTLDEKISEYLVPQVEEVSSAAKGFFQKYKAEDENWIKEAEQRVTLTSKAVEELNNGTKKVKDLLEKFQSKTNINWTRPEASTDWRAKYTNKDNAPPGESEPKEVWYGWLAKRFTHILEFLKDEIMPPLMVYTALPASLVVIVATLCPPLAHAAPGVMGAFATAVIGIFSLNKVLPSLIELLKNAQSGGGNNCVSRSSMDRIKDFMSSLQAGDGN